jgi:hypothetical protein
MLSMFMKTAYKKIGPRVLARPSSVGAEKRKNRLLPKTLITAVGLLAKDAGTSGE